MKADAQSVVTVVTLNVDKEKTVFIIVTDRMRDNEPVIINTDYIVKVSPQKLKYGNEYKTVASIILNRDYPDCYEDALTYEIQTVESFLDIKEMLNPKDRLGLK